jgi:hypothetical protein
MESKGSWGRAVILKLLNLNQFFGKVHFWTTAKNSGQDLKEFLERILYKVSKNGMQNHFT